MFTLDIVSPTNQVVGSCEMKMEDLLQAKFDNKVTLDMFDQVARVRVNTLIFLINKSEWGFGFWWQWRRRKLNGCLCRILRLIGTSFLAKQTIV